MKRWIVVDAGNTEVVVAAFHEEELAGRFAFATPANITADELALKCKQLAAEAGILGPVNGVLVGSVVPQLDAALREGLRRAFAAEVAFVGEAHVRTGLRIRYRQPKELGADRVANAVAAKALVGAPAVVVDCGTATTFDIVDEGGDYAGGLILPGPHMALEALAARTAKLPKAPLARPQTLIGHDTIESIQAGVFWGHVAAIEGIAERLRAQLRAARFVLTGGLVPVFADALDIEARLEPALTLIGLRLLAERRFP
ncbi:MAG: type III pantothenate kinase [Zetaproteobacteria bacterium]|nr:MAG: type III pantothenate kinase [Zetaproteobacteria bacterium]